MIFNDTNVEVDGRLEVINADPCPGCVVYAIGDIGPAGGKVFYITDGGLHGLEAAPVDQVSAQWCSNFTDIAEVDNIVSAATLDSHSGAHNTPLIVAVCGVGSAAGVAAAYVWPEGQTDGFLPNKDELNLMYQNKAAIGGFASEEFISLYWSSSEFNDIIVWVQYFFNGSPLSNYKGNTYRVRAARGF